MTTLETKMQILSDFWVTLSTDEEYADFAEVHDIGIPLAMLVIQGHALATESGVKWIETDYEDLCEELGLDKYGDYESLDEMLDLNE
jgi:hypothetical protein